MEKFHPKRSLPRDFALGFGIAKLNRQTKLVGWAAPKIPLTSFIRALDCGGTMVEGKDEYDTLEEALQDLDLEIEAVLKDIYGD
ncbi:MAG TPA: hypothetical protein IGS31_10820 [Oscillatoriales cyanobacterium M4454_W2019_049]|nr:MAG: hypothetical protein D6728_12985 [Cyanobacteria bacterium J055]HIK31818.1 hypothetical protein [Oscillatoriales cyanobacterium M4454_W2019_049]